MLDKRNDQSKNKRLKNSYTIIYLQLLLFFFLIFCSCSNNPKEVEVFIQSSENIPIEVMRKAELSYTENGKIKLKIMAEKIERFLNKNPSICFSKGVTVHFYNDSTNIVSTLTSEEAFIDDKNKQMMAKTNVELINQKEEKLNSEQLIWDEKSNVIFTKQSVSISTKDEVIFGDGFESTPDFSSYKITNVRGKISVNDNNDRLLR